MDCVYSSVCLSFILLLSPCVSNSCSDVLNTLSSVFTLSLLFGHLSTSNWIIFSFLISEPLILSSLFVVLIFQFLPLSLLPDVSSALRMFCLICVYSLVFLSFLIFHLLNFARRFFVFLTLFLLFCPQSFFDLFFIYSSHLFPQVLHFQTLFTCLLMSVQAEQKIKTGGKYFN